MNKRSQHLQSQAERLALENDRMEQRLQELRASLRKQKHERDAKGGYTWKAGRRSRISSHANTVIEDAQERRRKHAQGRRQGRSGAKQLPRPPPGGPPQSGKENGSRRRMPQPPATTPELSVGSARSTSTRATHQGQQRPSDSALDLGVDARRGGAPQPAVQNSRQRRFKRDSFGTSTSSSLAASRGTNRIDDWRQQTAMTEADGAGTSTSTSASASANAKKAATTTTTTAAAAAATASTGTTGVGTDVPDDYPPLPAEGGGKLLDGPAFDEAESGEAFAEAVRAWRNGSDATTTTNAANANSSCGGAGVGAETHAVTAAAAERGKQNSAARAWNPSAAVAAQMTSTNTQAGAGETSPTKKQVDLDIKFESNLSYLERLMLQKRRNNASDPSSKAASTSASPAPPRHTTRTSANGSGRYNDGTHADANNAAQDTADPGAVFAGDQDDDAALDTDFLQRRIKRWSVTDEKGSDDSEKGMRVEVRVAEVTDEGDNDDGGTTAAVVTEPDDVHVAGPTVVEPEDDDEDDDAGNAVDVGRSVAMDAMEELMHTQ